MRKADAIYAGEMSDVLPLESFAYSDGIIPWLLIWERLSTSNFSLSDLISERKNRFPSSGGSKFAVANVSACEGRNQFAAKAVSIDELDGLSMSFDTCDCP